MHPERSQYRFGEVVRERHLCTRGDMVGETTVLASDGRCLGRPSFEGFALSITVSDDARAERLFAALAEGGQVQMPLSKTFFARKTEKEAERAETQKSLRPSPM